MEYETIIQGLRKLDPLPRYDEWEKELEKTKAALEDFTETHRTRPSTCNLQNNLSSSDSLNLHIFCMYTSLLAAEYVWDMVLNETRPLFCGKENTQL